jgi:hypothetical protein
VINSLHQGDYFWATWFCFSIWVTFGWKAPTRLRITSRGIEQKSWKNGIQRITWSEIEFYKLWKPSREHEWKLEVKARRGKKIKRLYVGFDDREIAPDNMRQILHRYSSPEKELT